jgi:hypothetical protein
MKMLNVLKRAVVRLLEYVAEVGNRFNIYRDVKW